MKKKHRVVQNYKLNREVGKVIATNEGFCFLKMIKCRRMQATDSQKLKKIVNGRLLVFC